MLESINLKSNVAVFAQIENEVRFAIASGALKAGEKLPTVRAVADTLAVNPNTVAKAYRDLEIMGLVYTRRGMGIFIKEGVESQCQSECYRDIISKMHEVVAEAKAAGLKETDVKSLAKKCFASECTPYETPPSSIMALSRKM
tara:strand:- start:369 stop:797 length:429 start_codon:yes stop_codon:yes gene_type:complete